MEENNNFVLGNKEYTNQELLLIGREYYPKKYWIKRGIGLGLLLLALLCAIPLPFLFTMKAPDYPGGEYVLVYYRVALIISVVACLIPGIVLTILSFVPEKDITYINYAKRYLTKAFDRETKKEFKKMDQLKRYKKLLDSGVISQEEFDNKKKEYLE